MKLNNLSTKFKTFSTFKLWVLIAKYTPELNTVIVKFWYDSKLPKYSTFLNII